VTMARLLASVLATTTGLAFWWGLTEPLPVPPGILLGVSGGIAAYKALELVRLATKAGHAVRVIQTEASTRFVGTASFAAIASYLVGFCTGRSAGFSPLRIRPV